MASNLPHEILSILFLFLLLLSYSFSAKDYDDSDKSSDVNDFAEFETEDDDEGEESYEDETERIKPAERAPRPGKDEFNDEEDDADVETGMLSSFRNSITPYGHSNLYYVRCL